MKTKMFFLEILGVALIFSMCEQPIENYIIVPEQEPIVIYEDTDSRIRVESIETDKSTEYCSSGEIRFTVYENDSLINQTIYCKDTLPVTGNNENEEICPQYWDYLHVKDECDTLYNYDCKGNLNFKFTICEPEIVELPGDSIPYPIHDTIVFYDTILIHDTTTIVNVDTIEIKGKSFVREFFFEDFNNPGNTPHYVSEGWDVGEGFRINQISSSKGNGTIVLLHNLERDTLWSPQIFSEPMKVDSISIFMGSKEGYKTSVLLKDYLGNVHVVSPEKVCISSSSFDWETLSTYYHFEYSISLEEAEFLNIIKIGISVLQEKCSSDSAVFSSKKGSVLQEKCCPPEEDRNKKFNSENVFVRGIKQISE